MKYKVLFSIFTLFTAMSLLPNNDVLVVHAEEEDKYIYVDLSLNTKYLEENSNPYISYQGDKKINLILVDNDIYKSEEVLSYDLLSNDDNGFKVCCFDASINDYVSTSIIKSDLSKINYNYVCLDEYVPNEINNILGYGYYDEKIENPGATYATQRVWLNNENQDFYNEDAWGSKCKNVAGYIYQNKWYEIDMVATINSYDNRYYYYVDIPYEVSSIHFLRCSSEDNHDYLIYQDTSISYLMYGGCYFVDTESFNNIFTSTVNNADAYMLSLVVEAYLTYGKSDSNGCVEQTIKNLFNTWFKNKSASKNDLKNQKILDYTGYSSNGNSYEGLVKNSSFSINEKWNTMCSQVGINPETGEARGFDLSWFKTQEGKIVIAIGVTAVVLVAGVIVFIVIKKKREED